METMVVQQISTTKSAGIRSSLPTGYLRWFSLSSWQSAILDCRLLWQLLELESTFCTELFEQPGTNSGSELSFPTDEYPRDSIESGGKRRVYRCFRVRRDRTGFQSPAIYRSLSNKGSYSIYLRSVEGKPMTTDTTDSFSAVDAVRALAEIEEYDERLTARAFGLNLMVFAFAVAAIPISYAAADPWLATHGFGSLLLGVLWMPWIAAAITATTTIWSTHSITLGENRTAINEWLLGIGFTIAFFLVAIGVVYVFGSETNVFIVVGITGGVLTVFIGAVFHYLYRANWILLPLFVAGLGIVLVNVLLHAIGLPSTGAGFVTGLVQGSAYFVAGWTIATRG